jgi:site-specific DNA-methyltransferase (adenine-specific)
VQAKQEPSMAQQISSRKPFGFTTDFKDFEPINSKNDATTPQYILDSKDAWVKIYANKEMGLVKRESITTNTAWIDDYKVLLGMAYGERQEYPHFILGKPIVAEPNSCCTETYLVCGVFKTEAEANYLNTYLRTKFLRFLVSLRKNTQHITKARFEYVPQLPMVEPWTDEKLYARYALTEAEIAFIESMIKEMPTEC